MQSAQIGKNISEKFIMLPEAANLLSVTVDVLLEWNENNILKPTITQDGKIGYRKEQIDKFITIQKMFSGEVVEKETQENLQITSLNRQTDQVVPPVQKVTLPKKDVAEKIDLKAVAITRSIKNFSFPAILLFLLISISFLSLFYPPGTAPDHVDIDNLPIIHNETEKHHPLPQNTDNITISKTISADIGEPLDDKSYGSEKIDLSEKDLSALYNILGKNLKTASDSVNNSTTGSSTLLTQEKQIPPYELVGSTVEDPGSKLLNYASRPNTKGEISNNNGTSNALAINLGSLQMIGNESSANKNTNFFVLTALIITSIFSVIFIFKRQISMSGLLSDNGVNSSFSTTDISGTVVNNKFLELNQKTDGTVVAYFQSREYKISKPELNSESDQFIERLLSLFPDNEKEINYDILEDERLSLNAPLSKLVTRLGFVGLKRDLFFPRTSKKSVLFRRYLNEEDLTSMNISPDKISELLSS